MVTRTRYHTPVNVEVIVKCWQWVCHFTGDAKATLDIRRLLKDYLSRTCVLQLHSSAQKRHSLTVVAMIPSRIQALAVCLTTGLEHNRSRYRR